MEIFTEIGPLRAFLRQLKSHDGSLGFVPTMGALHHGHISLIQASQHENSHTVCSIYVNPTQFNNENDLSLYPRTLESDIDMLRKAGCDVLFCPDNSEMYSSNDHLKFDFGHLDKVMEGQFRPGHFSGVALVVSKLLHIVAPNKAYFGQKDFQQYKIIDKLVSDLKFNLELRCMPIEREPDGLAMSSRNARLNPDERRKAIIFYESLKQAKSFLASGKSMLPVKSEIKKAIDKIEGIRLEYLELADASNLILLENVSDNAILLIAGYVGEVRLIDNLFLES